MRAKCRGRHLYQSESGERLADNDNYIATFVRYVTFKYPQIRQKRKCLQEK